MVSEALDAAAIEALRERLARIEARISAACERTGRSRSDVTLVAVSKTFSAEMVEAAARAGVTDFGENRVQELTEKAAVVPGRSEGGSVNWHMVGHLQRNKAKEVVRTAELFHALDSVRLARELDRRAEQVRRRMPCLIQVNTSGEGTKEGVAPADVGRLVDEVAAFGSISIRGFMTVAAPVDDPEEVRHEFRVLCRVQNEQRRAHPELTLDCLSMGMSGDFEVAIEEGATHVRIGRSLFGERP